MTCLVAPIFLHILMRLGKISFRELTAAVAPSLLGSLSTVAAILLFQVSGALADTKPLTSLVAQMAVGGAAGLTVLLALDSQLYGMVASLGQRMLRSLSEGRA
jgi:hypothetical protein